jgi:hypothetical protein
LPMPKLPVLYSAYQFRRKVYSGFRIRFFHTDGPHFMLHAQIAEMETAADRLNEISEAQVCELWAEFARSEVRLKLWLMELPRRSVVNPINGNWLPAAPEAAQKLSVLRARLHQHPEPFRSIV